MANMFDKYKDAPDEMPVPTNNNALTEDAARLYTLKKEEIKALKRLTQALRKQNKLMVAKQKAEKKAAERAAAEKVDKRKRDSGEDGFFKKLGDSICKAVPKVLTALVTMAFGYFFNTKFAGKIPQTS